MERSLYSGRYCFVENLHQSKLMEPAEYSVISEWFKWITNNVDVGIDLIGKIYTIYICKPKKKSFYFTLYSVSKNRS